MRVPLKCVICCIEGDRLTRRDMMHQCARTRSLCTNHKVRHYIRGKIDDNRYEVV